MPLINEFQPNPLGNDPITQQIELSGTPGESFSGWIVSIESDPIGTGQVNDAAQVSGTFDSNGLLVVTIPDLEHPSFTLVLSSDFSGSEGDQLDADSDGTIDDPSSVFGTVFDAIGIPDSSGDEAYLYGTQLGGSDFTYTGDEPRLVFRSSSTGDWYAVNGNGASPKKVSDINGNDVTEDFPDSIAETPTFGDSNPECFVSGTLIETDNGEVAVEDLNVGDLVQTAGGTLASIKWIGRQTLNPEDVQNPMRGYPILIKAGALGDNLPVRDLYVSPDHALLVEDLLINAGALVNSVSIIQTEPTETFTYFHIELETHALLMAEGTYAESYLPQKEDRDCYENAAEYIELYPEGPSIMLWPLDYPRVSSYTTVPRYVRKRLQAIADALYGAKVLQTAS